MLQVRQYEFIPGEVIKYFDKIYKKHIKHSSDNYTILSLCDRAIKKKLAKLYRELRKKNTT